MALAKLLFLFALVVTYRRDWVERQIGRHLRALRLALRALVPRRVDADEAWSSAEFGASDRPPPRGSVHAARVADRMLTDRGRDILCGARASSRTPDDLGAPSAARVAAKLESQWETRRAKTTRPRLLRGPQDPPRRCHRAPPKVRPRRRAPRGGSRTSSRRPRATPPPRRTPTPPETRQTRRAGSRNRRRRVRDERPSEVDCRGPGACSWKFARERQTPGGTERDPRVEAESRSGRRRF